MKSRREGREKRKGEGREGKGERREGKGEGTIGNRQKETVMYWRLEGMMGRRVGRKRRK